ncbi:hypothetical protein DW322_17695 [Rhodococcus rhodnii]|uniref:Uncharacterized protein n=1 Tax=Rhodococcus rhodnii TaxID=38312 RepID=A0A6P2CLX4_9NOCA|nr:hypothetical protein DW322_17695 [Rhodococcus rhodnii]
MSELKLDEGTIEQCVAICDRMLDKLMLARGRASVTLRADGFGTLPSALQLAAGYERKAQEVAETLNHYIAAVRAMREAFEQGGLAYADADSRVSSVLRSIDSGGGRA